MENATFQYKTGQPKVKANSIAQKMKFSIKDFFSKYDPSAWKIFVQWSAEWVIQNGPVTKGRDLPLTTLFWEFNFIIRTSYKVWI